MKQARREFCCAWQAVRDGFGTSRRDPSSNVTSTVLLWTRPTQIFKWLTCPISWPLARMLDWLLGKETQVTFKRRELKVGACT
jgi:hypothetical protein